MCQVALDRAAAIGERLGLPGPVPAWRSAADKLRQTILDQSWDEDAQTLSEHLDGGGSLDASLLALPLRRVLPAGQLSEQIDPSTGEFTGNLPQAFSHIGVIASGVTLARAHAATGSHASTGGASA